jgi:hypothetical protein
MLLKRSVDPFGADRFGRIAMRYLFSGFAAVRCVMFRERGICEKRRNTVARLVRERVIDHHVHNFVGRSNEVPSSTVVAETLSLR